MGTVAFRRWAGVAGVLVLGAGAPAARASEAGAPARPASAEPAPRGGGKAPAAARPKWRRGGKKRVKAAPVEQARVAPPPPAPPAVPPAPLEPVTSAEALAAPGPAWSAPKQHGSVVVRTRSLKGGLRDVWAEAELAAGLEAVADVLQHPDRFASFVPRIAESRPVAAPEGEPGVLVYTRLELPWVSARDYVSRFVTESRAESGRFLQRWEDVDGVVPERKGTVRVPTYAGSWEAVAAGEGRTRVVYRLTVDPGGWLPGFAQDLAHSKGVPGTLRAVEREAARRAGEGATASARRGPGAE